MKVDKIKEVIAKRHGYQDNILGSRWGFAMQLTYRTKKQLQLYEEVIKELSERQPTIEVSEKYESKALNIADVSRSKKEYYMLVNKNGNPIITDNKLPIYWLKKIAVKDALKFNADIVKIQV